MRAVPRLPRLCGVVLAHLVALAGCYQPELRDCTVRCEQPSDCTGGQVCRDDGWCAAPGVTSCPGEGDGDNQATPDASAATGDASLCPLGCSNGTCVDGVCVIDCSATMACQSEVACPANLPCRIVCGDRACAKKINCGMATSCEVQCTGEASCQDEITCNANRCDIDCTGASSCKRRTKCNGACACDVTCTGIGSCAEPADCPGSTCQLGNGCSSLLAGCNKC